MLRLPRKIILKQPEDLMLQIATLLSESAPRSPDMSDADVSCTAPARRNASLQVLKRPRLPSLFKLPRNPHVCLVFVKLWNPLRLPLKTTSKLQKVVRDRQFFTLLTWERASRHGRAFFFQQLSFQKRCEHVMRFPF